VSRQDQLIIPVIDRDESDPDFDDIRLQIDLRLKLDEVTTVEAEILRESSSVEPTRGQLCQLACKIYDARRTRDRILSDHLFGEPAWDMLLALYCLPSRGEMLRPTALSHAAAVAETTGIRWQRILMDEDLIERGPVELSCRRQFVRLTEKGRALMDRYLTRLFFCKTPIPPHPDRAGG
jgi:DNA-binding MarR family transcriptional regulator